MGIARNRLAAIGTDGTLSAWNPDAGYADPEENQWVSTLAIDGTTVYMGGSFTTINGIARNYLAAIGTDGTLGAWNPGLNGFVKTLAVDGTTVYVGGRFLAIGGITRNHLAAFGTDGTLGAWNPDANNDVNTLTVDGTTVYVGGGLHHHRRRNPQSPGRHWHRWVAQRLESGCDRLYQRTGS